MDNSIKVSSPTPEEVRKMGVYQWPIWKKEESVFDWYYDNTEKCYFLEGDVEVELSNGEKIRIKKGDFVVFPKGLKCRWHINKAVRKHYSFE